MQQRNSTQAYVLLIHGIWMHGIELRYLGRQLQTQGFETGYFKYFSITSSPQRNIERLVERLESIRANRLHLVAHSLGGIVAIHALRQCAGLPPGRVVLIGSPTQGSDIARRFDHLHMGWMLGKSRELLVRPVGRWQEQRELGVIAGRVNFGVGMLAGGVTAPGDGTVSVAETMLDGATDRLLVDASHMGMLFQREVAQQTGAFLRNGCFIQTSQQ